MALIASIKTRVDGQELWRWLLPHGFNGLLSVEIEDPISVHEVAGGEIVFRPQGRQRWLERRDGRRLGHDLGVAEVVERPQSQSDIHALTRSLDPSSGFVRPTGDADVIDESVATDGALDETSESDFALLRRTNLTSRRRLSLQDPLAIQPDLYGLVAEAHKDVVPLAVADIDTGIEVSPSTRQIDAQGASLGMSIDLPMRARGLLAAGDEDVKCGLTIQLRADFDGQRPLFERRPTLRDHTALQSFPIFRRQRRHATGRLYRHRRSPWDRLVRPGAVLGLRAGRSIVQLRHEPLKPIEIIQ